MLKINPGNEISGSHYVYIIGDVISANQPMGKARQVIITIDGKVHQSKILKSWKMKSEDQRIAIAKAVGWTRIKRHGRYVILNPDGEECWTYDSRGNSYGPFGEWSSPDLQIPDYLKSLDAMHEAERLLFKMANTNEEAYEHALVCVTGAYQTYRATAAQRLKHFLKCWIFGWSNRTGSLAQW